MSPTTTPYLVSARKYRPQTFDTVVGQEHITTTLKNAIRSNQLAHAYLFCGPRGVGKTTCARILAKTINCENPTPDMEACGECASCRSFQENASFNIFELDAASNNSVDDIRELVNGVRFAPQQGKYKIYIIDEVHMLSASAFNAFLKTLEEPPPYAIFILATTEKHKILPTILSRCQIFDFKRITTRDTVEHLNKITAKEGLDADEAALHVIAQKSEGCMRDSLSMLDRIASFTGGTISYTATMEHLAMLDADFYFSLTDSLLAQDVSSALLLLDGVLAKGFEGDVIMQGMSEHLRNLLLCKDSRMARLLDVPTVHQKAYFEKAAQMPPSFILSSLNELNDAENGYKNASNKRLHVELCLIRLCYVLQAVSPETVKKNIEPQATSNEQAISNEPLPISSPQPYAAPVTAIKNDAGEEPLIPVTNEISTATINADLQPIGIQPPTPPNDSQQPPTIPNDPQQPSKRISANMLKSLDAALEQQEVKTQETKTLCQEEVDAAFEKYKEKMRADNRSVHLANFSMMRLECLPPDEIHITSPSDIVDSYAQNLRNELIDYFRAELGVQQLRITHEVKLDAALQASQPVVLSKQERYDEMVSKNPNLAKLRDGLNLQIDF